MNIEEKTIPTEEELMNNVPTQEELLDEVIADKFRFLAENPAVGVMFDPEEADAAGAFVEDALSFEDVIESAMLGEIPNP